MTETIDNDPNGFSLPTLSLDTAKKEMDEMKEKAQRAASFLKALGHEGRLMIVCFLCSGEKSVAELEKLLSIRQAAVSQQLSRLRHEGLIKSRREGKAIFYSLTEATSKEIIMAVYDRFCK